MATGTNGIATRTNANSKSSGAFASDLTRCVSYASAYETGDFNIPNLYYTTVNNWSQTLPSPLINKSITRSLADLTQASTYVDVNISSISVDVTFKNTTGLIIKSPICKGRFVFQLLDASNNIIDTKSYDWSIQHIGSIGIGGTATTARIFRGMRSMFRLYKQAKKVQVTCYCDSVSSGSVSSITFQQDLNGTVYYFEGNKLIKYSDLTAK